MSWLVIVLAVGFLIWAIIVRVAKSRPGGRLPQGRGGGGMRGGGPRFGGSFTPNQRPQQQTPFLHRDDRRDDRRDHELLTAVVVSDQLNRAADRFENAGDHERAARAREAAANVNDDNLEEARDMADDLIGHVEGGGESSGASGHESTHESAHESSTYTDNS